MTKNLKCLAEKVKTKFEKTFGAGVCPVTANRKGIGQKQKRGSGLGLILN